MLTTLGGEWMATLSPSRDALWKGPLERNSHTGTRTEEGAVAFYYHHHLHPHHLHPAQPLPTVPSPYRLAW